MTDLKWIVTETDNSKDIPEWCRSAALSSDGDVFVPAVLAAISGNEMETMLCAVHDGISVVIDDNHLYVPAKWIKENRSEDTELCDLLDRIMMRVFNHFGSYHA